MTSLTKVVRSADRCGGLPALLVGTVVSVTVGLLVSAKLTEQAALGVATFMGLQLTPFYLLFPIGMVATHGLGSAILADPVLGSLRITDLALMSWVLRSFVVGKRPLVSRTNMLLWTFLAWATFTTAYGGGSQTPLLRLWLYAVLSALLAGDVRTRSYTGHVLVAYAVVELAMSMPTLPDRLIGATLGDPAQLGMLLIAALCLLVTAEVQPRGRPLLIGFLIGGVVGTQTRGVWFAALVLLTLAFQARINLKRALGATAVLLAIGLYTVNPISVKLGLSSNSGSLRASSIESGIRDGLAAPLTGQGWGGSAGDLVLQGESKAATTHSAYNLFVNIFASTGVVGLVLVLAYCASLVRVAAQGDRSSFLFFAAFFALSLTEMTWFAGSLLTITFFYFAGLCQTKPEHLATRCESRRIASRKAECGSCISRHT